MLTRQEQIVRVATLVFCLILICTTLAAQPNAIFPGIIIFDGYLLVDDTPQSYYGRLTQDDLQFYINSETECFSFSPGGLYFSQYTTEDAIMTVRRTDSLDIIFSTGWQSNWGEPCGAWLVGNPIIVIEVDGVQIRYRIVDGQLQDPEPLYYRIALPDRGPEDALGIFLPSPERSIFLYETCSGADCGGDGDFVIYDERVGQPIATMIDAVITENVPPAQNPRVNPRAAWSPDGNFFAYAYASGKPDQRFDLKIYNMSEDTYQEYPDLNVEIDWRSPIYWSPQSDKILFFVAGRLYESQPGESDTLKTPIVLDVATGVLQVADQPYNAGRTGIWSSDGQYYGFVTIDDKRIVIVDAMGLSYTVPDVQAYDVIGLISPPKPTAETPTPTNTPTATATPTVTSIPPTATTIPPTATTVPPTATRIPPTATTVPPTATSIPPTATTVPPTATTAPSGVSCTVTRSFASQWSNGYTANVYITNNGATAINGWTLTLRLNNGEQVTGFWRVQTYSQTGGNPNTVTANATSNHYNGTINAGSTTDVRFQVSHNGTYALPTTFTLNGVACILN